VESRESTATKWRDNVARAEALALEFGHFEFTTAPNLITALSKGRGYGEAGGEGFFSSVTTSESLTRRFAAPPLSRERARAVIHCYLAVRSNVQTREPEEQALG